MIPTQIFTSSIIYESKCSKNICMNPHAILIISNTRKIDPRNMSLLMMAAWIDFGGDSNNFSNKKLMVHHSQKLDIYEYTRSSIHFSTVYDSTLETFIHSGH